MDNSSATADMSALARQMLTRLSAVERQVTTTRAAQRSFHSMLFRCAAEIKSLLVAIFNVLTMSIEHRARSLPCGVLFKKPLVLQDACGKYFPVHIEWTSCWEVSALIGFTGTIG